MDLCGNGTCDRGEEASCPEDCAGTCAHTTCVLGAALTLGCDSCVDMVCGADPYCCDSDWDGQCIDEAENLCGVMCCGDGVCSDEDCASCETDCGACVCGDGVCAGEDCVSCEGDCGACVCGDGTCLGEDCGGCAMDCGPCPTCPHAVCATGAALDTTLCRDACVDEVCAASASCCGDAYTFSGACAFEASTTCGPDACIDAVCTALPGCCNGSWDQSCVNAVIATCGVSCACAHDLCVPDMGPLATGCDPCVDAICLADPYCCNADWDGICVDEIDVVCGILCP